MRFELLRRYLIGEDLQGSERMLESLQAGRLDTTGRWRLALLRSEFNAISGQFKQALDGIEQAGSSLPSPMLAPELRLSHAHTLIAMGAPRSALQRLSSSEPGARTQTYRNLLWKAHTSIPLASAELNEGNSTDNYQASESLQLLVRSLMNASTLADQKRILLDLEPQALGPLFDGQLPSPLRLIENSRADPIRVALLLPLSGSLSPVGNAFLEGFISAWYAAGSDSDVNFLVYDADDLSLDSDYARFANNLIGDRVQLVVGPISRAKIARVQGALPAEMGWIALNRLEGGNPLTPGQFVMELSTEEELRNLAWRIQSQQANRVLVYYQSSGWSNRALSTLEDEFGEHRFIGKVRLSTAAAVTEEVGLSLLVDRSEARIRAVDRILHGAVETQARRRQDLDAVVALVDGDLSSALQPALRYHGAGDVPLFGTSRILRGLRASDYVNFEGARLFELPWNLRQSAQKARIETQFGTVPPAVENFRAIGLDCFRLVDRFHLIRESQQAAWFDSMQGAAGLLRVAGNRIDRDLVWSEIRSGSVRALAAEN